VPTPSLQKARSIPQLVIHSAGHFFRQSKRTVQMYKDFSAEVSGTIALKRAIRKRKKLTPEQTRLLIGRLRIGDLNKIFGRRYGGGRENYMFPEDDSGHEDLIILLQHYLRSNPHKMPRIIKLRAPWADADRANHLLEHVAAYPRQWKAQTLGRELRLTAAEWRLLDLRTIAPADMTVEERKQDRKLRARLRKRHKRRAHGMKSRAEFLAANDISRTKPWLASGMSRATWYRQQAKVKGGQPPGRDRSVHHKEILKAVDTPVSPSQPPVPEGIDERKILAAATSAPEVSLTEVYLSALRPIAGSLTANDRPVKDDNWTLLGEIACDVLAAIAA